MLWNSKILEICNNRNVHLLVYGEKISCGLLLIQDPHVFQEVQKYLPTIEANEIVVTVHQDSFGDYKNIDLILWDLKRCRNNIERYFGSPGIWYPLGPDVREAMMRNPEWNNVLQLAEEEDGVNIVFEKRRRLKK
jgi:hypothetical protein